MERHRSVAQQGAARLLHYGGNGRPVVFVPSIINPHFILDLDARQSLLGSLVAQGLNVHLVDWGMPLAQDRDLDLGGHVTKRLLPLLAALDEPPVLVGYCLGGTLAAAASGLINVAALAMIAAPWRFDAFATASRAEIVKLWTDARPVCERIGYVPMEVLQSGFWSLDPERTIRKFADFADTAPDSEEARAFVTLEDWANEGAPLTFAAGRELFERLYADDVTGRGEWRVGGKMVDPGRLPCPTLSIASSCDRIVPCQSAPPADENWTLDMGHVGMIVGRRAPEKLWAPLAQWLSTTGT